MYVLFVIWVLQRCGRTLNSVSPNLAMEEPIFSMNWPSIPVQGMLAQHWLTHYTHHHFLFSLHPYSTLLSLIQHFTHPSLPPLCTTYIHPTVFCFACPLHHFVHPALPPTWLFLPCLARNHPAEVLNGRAVSVSFFFHSMWVFRGRGGRCRKRQWLKDVSQVPVNPDRFSLPESWQCQSP